MIVENKEKSSKIDYNKSFFQVKKVVMGLDKFKRTPCGFCFVEYYSRLVVEGGRGGKFYDIILYNQV